MDPVSALGLVSSLIAITQVAAGSLIRVKRLQSKYKSSSLVLSLLFGQLNTLKAALTQITEWITSTLLDISEQQQLMSDLEISLESCKILIAVLEERVAHLELNDQGVLNFRGKTSYLRGELELNEFGAYLNNQIGALNLFLTALNCRTTFERNVLLHKNESREIIKRARDSVASLRLRDSGSFSTRQTRQTSTTENTNLLDVDFTFDDEVVASKVYKTAIRFNIRSVITKSKSRKSVLSLPSIQSIDDIKDDTDSEGLYEYHPTILSNDFRSSSRATALDVKSIPESNGPGDYLSRSTEESLNGNEKPRGDVTLLDPLSSTSTKNWPFNEKTGIWQKVVLDQFSSRRSQISGFWTKGDSSLQPFPEASLTEDGFLISPDMPKQSGPDSFGALLLGSGNSGKTSIFKSIQARIKGGWPMEDRKGFVEIIYINTVQNMKDICDAMMRFEIHTQNNSDHIFAIENYLSTARDGFFVPSKDVWHAIEALWEDDGVQRTFQLSNEYLLQEAAAYFFNSVGRLQEANYTPNDEDIQMVRIRTTGSDRIAFQLDQTTLTVVDTGGERAERKKWGLIFGKHFGSKLDGAHVFIVDISAYDLALYEDLAGNRLTEDLLLFESIVNRQILESVLGDWPTILVFTKLDILESKIAKFSFKKRFHDFTGDEGSLEDVKLYMENRFLSRIREPNQSIPVVYTRLFSSDNNLAVPSPAKLVLDAIMNCHSDIRHNQAIHGSTLGG